MSSQPLALPRAQLRSGGNSGLICMASYDGYPLGQAVVTPPLIYLASDTGPAVGLMKVDHPQSGWSSAEPLTSFAWIH